MKIKLLLSILLTSFYLKGAAQITFEKTFSNSYYNDYVSSVQQTTDGGYIMVGSTDASSSGLPDLYLIKTNSYGDTLWTKTFGDNGQYVDYGSSIRQTTDAGFIIVGGTNLGMGNKVYLIKTNGNGDTLWTRTYAGNYGNSVQQTYDGGYIIAADYYVNLIKTDANGDTLWTKSFGGGTNANYMDVKQTVDDGYIITGKILISTNNFDVFLIKTNANGDTLWTKTYGGANDDAGSSVQQTTDGGYIITGSTMSFGSGGYDVYLIRTDVNGDTLWTKTYGGANADMGSSIQQTTDGGYIIAGSTMSFGSGGYDVYLIKIDANGDTLWTITRGGTFADGGASTQQTDDGGYILGGYQYYSDGGFKNVYYFKTDSNGNVNPTYIQSQISNLKSPISIYPNPFISTATITIAGETIQSENQATGILYDVFGQKVKIFNIQHSIFNISRGDLSEGIYFFKIISNNRQYNQKLIIAN